VLSFFSMHKIGKIAIQYTYEPILKFPRHALNIYGTYSIAEVDFNIFNLGFSLSFKYIKSKI
jgi:hypothetical protein